MSDITLFGVDIAAEINAAMAQDLLPATLHKVTAGSRTSGQQTSGANPTETDHACRGFVEEGFVREGATNDDGSLVTRVRRRVNIVGDSIVGGAVPEANDNVTIEGIKHRVLEVKRDPAKALYTLSVER
jgi:hypothetical protein